MTRAQQRRSANSSVSDESQDDAGVAALQMQQRMLKFRKTRDKRISQIIADCTKAFSAIEGRIQKVKKEGQRQRQKKQAEQLTKITDLAEQRQQIEAKMVAIVADMCKAMTQVEEIMLAGYEARERHAEDLAENFDKKESASDKMMG